MNKSSSLLFFKKEVLFFCEQKNQKTLSIGAVRCHRQRHTGGDDRDRTDDPLLAKQVLSQLSYAPSKAGMGQGGFEPPTPRLSSVCSNQLSY